MAKWLREDDVLTLDLYFKAGRRSLPASRREVIELSKIVEKTPASVTMRMGNILAVDRPGQGLGNYSQQTKSVWDEFASNEQKLKRTASLIRKRLLDNTER